MSWSLILPHCPARCLSLERHWKSHPESELLCGRRRRKKRDKHGHKESPNRKKKAIHWHEKEQTSCWLIKRTLSSCTVCVYVCVCVCVCLHVAALHLMELFSYLAPFSGRWIQFYIHSAADLFFLGQSAKCVMLTNGEWKCPLISVSLSISSYLCFTHSHSLFVH